MNSAQQQYTPPDGEGHIRKKPRKYKFLDKGAPFRAIVAHQYRQYYRNQTKTTTDIKWFLSYIVPHIPGANVQYDPPSSTALRKWIKDYDEGAYDDILSVYKEQRVVAQETYCRGRMSEEVNRLVLDKLCQLSVEELEHCTPKQLVMKVTVWA